MQNPMVDPIYVCPSLLGLGTFDRCPALLARRRAIGVYPVVGTTLSAFDLLFRHA